MNEIIEIIKQPWPWYVSGPLIALTMFALLFAGKQFGMSSNLRTLCSIGGAGRTVDFFRFNWRAHIWNLLVVLGAIAGGYIAANYLSHGAVEINPAVKDLLLNYGFESAGSAYLPAELFSDSALNNIKTIAILLIGGVLVGFGARYAGGCTSGHAISGLSNLQLPSLIAVIGFFIGGLTMIHFIYPLIF